MSGLTINDPIQLPSGLGAKTIDVPQGETRFFAVTLPHTEACAFNLHSTWYPANEGDTLAIHRNGNLLREQVGTLILDLPAADDYVLRIDANNALTTLNIYTLS
jgi:hypothetical protein